MVAAAAAGSPRRAAALICLADEQRASLEPLGTDLTITSEVMGLKPVWVALLAIGHSISLKGRSISP